MGSIIDAEFESLRDDAEADILMLIVDPSGSSCCRGSTRYQLPGVFELSMIYVLADFVDNTLTYTPAHEIGHVFGAYHDDGYYLKDSSGYSVYDICRAGQPPGYYDARTLMYTYSYPAYDARTTSYSSASGTVSFWCPDQSSTHVFNLGTGIHDTEDDYIESYENLVSNIYETAVAAKIEEAHPLLVASSFDDGSKGNVISYPNPFNPSATIRFSLDEDSRVSLSIYDLLGREIDTLVNGRMSVGRHDVTFDGTDLPSGVYTYILRIHNEANVVEHTGIMNLVK